MTQKPAFSMAQLADQILQRTALGVFLMAIAFAIGAGMHVVSDDTAALLDKIQLVFVVTAVIAILPTFYRYVRLRTKGECEFDETESYIGNVFNKAGVRAFGASFMMLAIAGPIGRKRLPDLSPEFFDYVVLAVSLAVFSITFFASIERDEEED